MSEYRQTSIPNHTDRTHLGEGMSQWRGDSNYAIRVASRKPKGRRDIDLNMQGTLDGVVNLHSGTPAQNDLRFIVVRPGKRRALTYAELHRPLAETPTATVLKMRLTDRYGPSRKARYAPGTYAARVSYATRKGVRVCAEIKWPVTVKQAVQMVAYATSLRTTVFFMALVYQVLKTPPKGAPMTIAGLKAQHISQAGGQFALLTHGFAPPHDLEDWRPFIAAYWGVNAQEYR